MVFPLEQLEGGSASPSVLPELPSPRTVSGSSQIHIFLKYIFSSMFTKEEIKQN